MTVARGRLRYSLQVARQNEFQHQVIGRIVQTDAGSRLDRPRFAVVVDDAKELVVLLRRRIKSADRSKIIVFFRGQRPRLVEVISKSRRRREIEARKSLVGIVEDRIDDQVVSAKVPADDGADFRGVAVLIPVRAVPAEFEIYAVEEGLAGGIGFHEQRTDL